VQAAEWLIATRRAGFDWRRRRVTACWAGPYRFESAFGADLGRIRLHTGPPATELNERAGASAFTAGSHVFFRRGLPDASSAGGQHLAHEITHAMQQGALRVDRQSLDAVSPRPAGFEAAVVTKPAGAPLHKSDRKQKALDAPTSTSARVVSLARA
jgi:hypothetical protein